MNSNDVSPIWYWLVLLIYILFVGYLGWRAYQQQKACTTAEEEHNDFWITGRKQPAYMVGMSIASGWMLIGMITWMTWATYDQGFSGLWIVAIPWMLTMIIQVTLVPWLRRIRAISQCQMLEQRFGLSTRIFSAIINIFSYTLWSAAELYAASLVMAPALNISIFWMIIIYAVPIAIYMWLGGFRSVINANILQFFMGAIIMVVVSIAMYYTAAGICNVHGTTVWSALQHQTVINSAAYPYDPTIPASSFFGYTGLALPLAIMIGLIPGWGGAEDFWLKAQSAATTKDAYKGTLYMIVYNALLIVIPASLIGVFGLIIFKPELVKGTLTAASALGDKGGYNVISVYINNYMTPWVKASMIFLLSAHSMSTVANYSNMSAMNLSFDVLQPLYFKKHNWPEVKIVKYSRLICVVIILFNILLAMLYNDPTFGASLNDAYFLSSGLLTAGVAIMLYAMFWKRANLRGALMGGSFGTIGSLIFFILEYKIWDFSYTMPIWDSIFGKGSMASTYLGYCVVGLVAGIIGLFIGTYTGQKPSAEQLAAIADHPVDDTAAFFEGVSQ
jgi:solute:Na+ symporter, SSS family